MNDKAKLDTICKTSRTEDAALTKCTMKKLFDVDDKSRQQDCSSFT